MPVNTLQVVETIESLTLRQGYPPSLKEVGDSLGIVKSAVKYHVDKAMEKWLVAYQPNQERTLVSLRKKEDEQILCVNRSNSLIQE